MVKKIKLGKDLIDVDENYFALCSVIRELIKEIEALKLK